MGETIVIVSRPNGVWKLTDDDPVTFETYQDAAEFLFAIPREWVDRVHCPRDDKGTVVVEIWRPIESVEVTFAIDEGQEGE